jgi:hypothetical protein
MALPAIIISTFCYLLTSINCYIQKDYPHFVMWSGYVFANLGLLWYEYTKLGR